MVRFNQQDRAQIIDQIASLNRKYSDSDNRAFDLDLNAQSTLQKFGVSQSHAVQVVGDVDPSGILFAQKQLNQQGFKQPDLRDVKNTTAAVIAAECARNPSLKPNELLDALEDGGAKAFGSKIGGSRGAYVGEQMNDLFQYHETGKPPLERRMERAQDLQATIADHEKRKAEAAALAQAQEEQRKEQERQEARAASDARDARTIADYNTNQARARASFDAAQPAASDRALPLNPDENHIDGMQQRALGYFQEALEATRLDKTAPNMHRFDLAQAAVHLQTRAREKYEYMRDRQGDSINQSMETYGFIAAAGGSRELLALETAARLARECADPSNPLYKTISEDGYPEQEAPLRKQLQNVAQDQSASHLHKFQAKQGVGYVLQEMRNGASLDGLVEKSQQGMDDILKAHGDPNAHMSHQNETRMIALENQRRAAEMLKSGKETPASVAHSKDFLKPGSPDAGKWLAGARNSQTAVKPAFTKEQLSGAMAAPDGSGHWINVGKDGNKANETYRAALGQLGAEKLHTFSDQRGHFVHVSQDQFGRLSKGGAPAARASTSLAQPRQ